MNRLTEEQEGQRSEIAKRLKLQACVVQSAIDKFNDMTSDLWKEMYEEVNEYNEVIKEAKGFQGKILDEMNETYTAMDGMWETEDEAERYFEWLDRWSVFFESLVFKKPMLLETPDELDDGEVLESLPSQPERENEQH